MKRLVDITVSAAVLTLGFPVLVVVAALVWFDSGRPVLFSQERVGQNFRSFRIWKFRSMRPCADGPSVTAKGDQRITRIGAILRATKLDELPQFWNVFLGEMSLVGPRPELPEYVELYHEEYARILKARPGITDPASLAFRNEESILCDHPDPEQLYRQVVLPKKLHLAESYLAEQSTTTDAIILFRTFIAIFHS